MTLFFLQGVPTKVEEFVGRVIFSLGHARRTDLAEPQAFADYAEVEIPATPIARAAAALCRDASQPWLRDHCYRTHVLGALLGRGISFDAEMLFVACMLHDIGLTKDFRQGSGAREVADYARKDAPCFAVRGGGVAQRLAADNGCSKAFGDALAEAISLHVNARVPRSRSVEAHLLNAGSAFDVIRLGSHKLPKGLIETIETRWPRENDFCNDLWKAWADESRIHHDCRGAFLDKWGSFERAVFKTCPSTLGA